MGRRAGIRNLVKRLQSGSVADQAAAALALHQMHESAGDSQQEAVAAAIADAGAIPALLQLVSGPGEHPGAAAAAGILAELALNSPARCEHGS